MKISHVNYRFWRYFCLLYPAIWLYLPNLVIIYFSSEFELQLKTVGLLLFLLCTLPVFILISKNLRQFWIWNFPFAIVSGFYAGYIFQYHSIPYDGIWFAIWNASTDVILDMSVFFSHSIMLGLLGVVLYLVCAFHPIQKQIRFTKPAKQYLVLMSLILICVNYVFSNLLAKKVDFQRLFDMSVVTKSYPWGMVTMLVKTGVSVSHQQHIKIPPLQRIANPSEREIYVFVLGEAARAEDWLEVSQRLHSSLLKDPDIKIFKNAVSQANLTSFALPLIMTGSSTLQEAMNRPIVPQFAQAAGFTTGWITNSTEPFKYSYQNDFYDLNFDHLGFEGFTSVVYDDVLLPEIKRAISQGPKKLFIVVHLIGSHFDYLERYHPDLGVYPVNDYASTKVGTICRFEIFRF